MRSVETANLDPRLEMDSDSVTRCLRAIEAQGEYPVQEGSLEVAFVDEPECSRLHETFFGDPEITDVMTFPGEPEDDHAGDIAICPKVAMEAASETGLPFHEELTLYLVHAWLHLGGLDDRDAQGRRKMRKAEESLMRHLRENTAMLKAKWADGP